MKPYPRQNKTSVETILGLVLVPEEADSHRRNLHPSAP
jgi:hypothetical protein